jgi:hypothetical protein
MGFLSSHLEETEQPDRLEKQNQDLIKAASARDRLDTSATETTTTSEEESSSHSSLQGSSIYSDSLSPLSFHGQRVHTAQFNVLSTVRPSNLNCGRRKPRDVVCHICGRNYTIHSINLHIPQCEKIYQQRQGTLPKSERKPLPKLDRKPDSMDLKARNELALKIYNGTSLEACQFCNRTFLPDRLSVHLPSCARNHKCVWPPRTKSEYPIARCPLKAKNTVICHICGRNYSTRSINLHVPQCANIYQQQQARLPKSERKPMPKLPLEADSMDLEARNQLAMKIYDDTVLEACQFCNRTFLPDRLRVHLPSCARNHKSEWPPRTKSEYPGAHSPLQANNTILCHICGRKYTTHSIDLHVPQCAKIHEQQQAKLPKSQRKPLPQLPQNYNARERNEVATQVYYNHALEACKYCDRRFLPDRLEVHISSCRRQKQVKQQPRMENATRPVSVSNY